MRSLSIGRGVSVSLAIVGGMLVGVWGQYLLADTEGNALEPYIRFSGIVGFGILLIALLLALSTPRRGYSGTVAPVVDGQEPNTSGVQGGVQPEPADKAAAIAHLENLRRDIRAETKSRIKQRDNYSIELTFALAAIFAIALARTDAASSLGKVLIAAPLISIYFTVLILYSYRIHKLLTRYMLVRLEPELARLCGTPPQLEWEKYYTDNAVPGIRRWFFLLSLWVVSGASIAFLWWTYNQDTTFIPVLIVASIVYALGVFLVTVIFWRF